ncbi:M23 family metallopeptidase [Alphaproteobacteria bacterium]|nr:M23 family metallopeptidase [Alphaproteobacteria bacterium]
MIVLLNKDFSKYKSIILFLFISTITFIYFLNHKETFFSKAKAEETIRKSLFFDQTNKNTIEEVLKAVGYKKNEAIQATSLLLNYFPLEKLNKSSYLILPPIGKAFKKFALNIDGKDAILINKNNNFFTAYITSAEQAQSIVSNEYSELDNLEGILKLEEKKVVIKNNLVFKEIYFKKGSTLTKILWGMDNKEKIRGFIRETGKVIDLSKIKAGSNGKVIIFNKKVYAIYIGINKKEVALTYLTSSGFKSKKINKKIVDIFIENQIEPDNKINNIKIIRVSLFNSPHFNVKHNTLKKGQSFYKLLRSYDISASKINTLIQSVEPYYNLKKIKVGQAIDIIFNKNVFYGFSYKINKIEELQLIKNEGGFDTYIFEKVYKKDLNYKEVKISKNLYLDSKEVGLPKQVFIDLVKLLSFSIDFQRDIRKNAIFKVMYEELYDYKGNFIKVGNIIYSKVLSVNQNNLEMFYFKDKNINGEYYDIEGKSIRKTLMRTPIDGARISSKFGKRRHPILGYNKMHKGLDFAARSGTPIFAAGDGIIERANFYGGYGRYIRIKHNAEYKTAYAHLLKFAKNIKRGNRVKQGSTIGFVGTSGKSTGPHLHYEVIFNNKQINPYNLRMPEIAALKKDSLNAFQLEKSRILIYLEKLERKD